MDFFILVTSDEERKKKKAGDELGRCCMHLDPSATDVSGRLGWGM